VIRVVTTLRPGFFLAVCAAAVLSAGRARADDTEDARAFVQKATAAFALTHYGAAAENFEKAFELRPDGALLYNAAQAHRLAGNKERALALYKNYLRLYAKKEQHPEVQARIDELEKAIEHDKAIAAKPPNTTEPVAGTAPEGAGASAAPPPPPAQVAAATPASPASPALAATAPSPAAPVLVAQPAPPAEKESLLGKPWFWVAGGGVAVAVVVVLLLTMGGSNDPAVSIGRATGN
jgi:uncharacterized membrane protein